MDPIIDLIKILGPASLVLYASYLLVRAFVNKQLETERVRISQKNQEIVVPIRLQAYERVCLLLERISPTNLITRLNKAEYSALEFQNLLVSEVREEYNHNLSQQLYMSEEAWHHVSGAVESTLSIINEAGESMVETGRSLELAKKIFELSMERNPTGTALTFVKSEIRAVF